MIPIEKKLLDLLSNNDVTFFIPPYQRNYEWTDEQCEVFYNDLEKTLTKNTQPDREEHFFGSVTYVNDNTPFGQPDKLVLIDGQQRITTTMLFLIAMRDISDDDNLKSIIENKYLKNNNSTVETEYKVKLKQVETDWNSYKNLVLGEELTDIEKNSAVYHNYQFFYNKIKKFQKEEKNLSLLLEKGLRYFSVITIELEPDKNTWENPQEIFESMNSIGKPLSLADLVRNYLLLGLTADKQTEYYNKYWLKLEKTIPHKISDFIRDYMQSIASTSLSKATERNYKTLYAQFKEIFVDCNAEAILSDLLEYSKIYKFIISDSQSGNEKIDRILFELRKLNITTAYSFLLVFLHKWKNGEINDFDMIESLDAFRIYCYRKRILGITQQENKVFPTLVKYINEIIQSDDKRLATFKILSNLEHRLRLINDGEFTRHMEVMNFYNYGSCKIILALIEEYLTKSFPDINQSNLQIEHIMPQKLNDEWRAELGDNCDEMHADYVHNVGNLTLIRHNQELGQKPFAEKKEIYNSNEGLQIAKTKITNCDKWNQETIEERRDWIIRLLIDDVLPIPDQMRKTNNFITRGSTRLSLEELQLIGCRISFIEDTTITAKVIGDTTVEFEGNKWKLSPLTRELKKRNGTINKSGSYQGAQYWEYEGIKLADIM